MKNFHLIYIDSSSFLGGASAYEIPLDRLFYLSAGVCRVCRGALVRAMVLGFHLYAGDNGGRADFGVAVGGAWPVAMVVFGLVAGDDWVGAVVLVPCFL